VAFGYLAASQSDAKVVRGNTMRKHLRIVTGGLAAAALLTACGGSATPPSVAALGQKLGCFSAPVTSQPTEMFAREDADCNFQMDDQSSQRATLYTFATAEAQANWTKMANAYGGVRVDGKLWTVTLDGQVAGATAQKRLGGVLK
jgi:hypothetical protein